MASTPGMPCEESELTSRPHQWPQDGKTARIKKHESCRNLNVGIDRTSEVIRARKPERLHFPMTYEKVKVVLANLKNDKRLLASTRDGAARHLMDW